jgi:hypothetical protein
MHSRTIDVVTDWETVATPAGYEGLRRLADRGFSGAVSAGPTWAFFLNGRIVGIFEGGIEDFEDADATAYRAADPSLPLLFAMQERDGDTRANYYTNETPLRDVDQTLSNGGFTGYIELSENVLSGDYYVVYHGGKSMSAAFVGSSERLITGEEAFETAADEVGIYEVIDVDVDLVDIPEPAVDDDAPDGDDVPAAGAAGGVGDADTTEEAEPERRAEHAVDDEPGTSDLAPEPALDPDGESEPGPRVEAGGPPADAGSTERVTDPDADVDPGSDPDVEPSSDTAADPGSDAAVDSEPDAAVDPEPDADSEREAEAERGAGATAPVTEGESPPTTEPDTDVDAKAAPDGTHPGTDSDGRPIEGEPGSDGALTDEERWRRARTIPSLDPEESSGGDSTESGDGRDEARERTAQMQRQRRRRRAARDRTNQGASRRSAGAPRSGGDAQGGADVDALKQRLSRARERIESLEDERDSLLAEREELIEERDELRNERAERIEELEAERERLRSEVDRLQSRLDADDGGHDATESMSPDRALSGTNLFVRYDSKGQATLKHAHAGDASRSDVRENLRLEHHTTFESEGVAVDGRSYEEFLRDSTEHAFAQWVVGDLLYEIGETGNRSGLAGLFDAIPDIDRVEIRGEVGVETDDGVEQRSFDVVFRDRMGDPLFVADINPSRDATTEAMVGSLVENTHTVASEAETLAAGFYVTESFFEPGALETVADRTGGGILSRSSKRSFVKLSRKRGYHLCLVEARDGEFHLNVPEL